jgi:S1-C subfamily serine protease
MSKLEGFYPIEAYSSTTAFNPVTDQVALIGTGELRIFQLGNRSHEFHDKGSYQPVAAWSSDGAWLFVAGKEQGMSIYENELTPEDRATYAVRLKDQGTSGQSRRASRSPSKSTAPKASQFKKLPTLTKFTPESVLAKSKAKAAAAARSKSEVGPPKMKEHALYSGESEALQQVLVVLEKFDPKEAGLAVYQLKGVLKEHPDFVPAIFASGMAHCANNNYSEGIPFLLTAVRSDAGQSTVTTESLCLLADVYLKNGSESEALDCLGTALMLDINNDEAIRLITPLMNKHGIPFRRDMEPAKAKVGGLAPATPEISPTNVLSLRLPPHRKTEKVLSTEELFAVVAQRTASIKTDSGFGSGVFITDEGHLLTNHHVVHDPSSSIDVTMFAMKNGQLERSGVSPATIVFADATHDIAVLKVTNPAAGQKGLSLSKDPPATGMKIFAIGSPGLGDRVLEQSLTEGIISSNQRKIEGESWLQHSAAISPGNSGGPLVSQHGEIIGLVTLKSKLENVGFAIPAARVREVLKIK